MGSFSIWHWLIVLVAAQGAVQRRCNTPPSNNDQTFMTPFRMQDSTVHRVDKCSGVVAGASCTSPAPHGLHDVPAGATDRHRRR